MTKESDKYTPQEIAHTLAISTWNLRCGVAMSQVQMGHWTPEFYAERMKVYKAELRTNLLAAK